MEALAPSIFNDVIGPVMRGSSSSHCAAGVRIGRLARDLMDGDIRTVRVAFDPNGSLATTHATHGSDMGLFGGLLGWEADDQRLPESDRALAAAGIRATIEITDIGATHTNTYRLTMANRNETHCLTVISTGGGMIEVIAIDDVPVSMVGDYYEVLVFVDAGAKAVTTHLARMVPGGRVKWCQGDQTAFVEVKTPRKMTKEDLHSLARMADVTAVKQLAPVLPILSRDRLQVPFGTCEEMLAYNRDRNLQLWQLAVCYESARGDIPAAEVIAKMEGLAAIMNRSLENGLAGTVYNDRILGHQSGRFQTRMASGGLLEGGLLNRIQLYITALMEVKSAMGVIVAAPTAGACGTLPGTCIGAARELGLGPEATVRGLLAAGMVGIFIANGATFAGEVGGCQAECGSASGMAAAALVTLAGGSARQAVDGAAMALQNVLGMVCDPVANRVEVPCLGKNVLAAANALTCANMALADFDAVVPLDEVIGAMNAVGPSIPFELRCTALGGLSVTPSARRIEKRLENG